ncbi:MAG TPA: peptidoglycan DD-metalloendopeptidase family protein [Burkholderiales bacterium]
MGLATLPLFGIVAAFGIAPDTAIDSMPVTTVVERLVLPKVESAAAPTEYWREERVQRGDTIASLLARLEVQDPAALNVLRATRGARSLYQLVPGRPAMARVGEDGRLMELRYLNASGTELVVLREGDNVSVNEQSAEQQKQTLLASGEIRSSLFAATDAAGLPDSIATQIADVFASDIDFHRDLRKGDRFTVVYEMVNVRGEPLRAGRVLAAEFVNDGKAHRAVWFQGPEGHAGGYYAPDGKNLRTAFLRSPLEFSRVSSGFSSARYHPVLKEWRAHRGIDYAAPAGTRVRATADGMVEFIGRQGGYGNLLVLQHGGRYSTAYGHLKGFAGGLRRGSRVSQGDVIGYVGATGLATGPHLHYEFRLNGEQRNPLTVAMPAAEPVPAHLRAAFEAVAAPLSARLEQLAGLNLARLD